ncbi:MAG: hypothetical protein ACE5E7_06465, partial [Anaerolineae bacterium]
DDRLGPITLSSTTLLPGESASGSLSYTIVEGDLPGPLTNTVTVSGTPPVGVDVTGSDIASVDLTSHPAIQMVKTASTAVANVGEAVTYTYTVSNSGDVSLVNVSASDDRLGPITLSSTTLLPGESATGTASYLVTEGDLPGPISSTVTAEGTPPVGAAVSSSDGAVIGLTFNPALQIVEQASSQSIHIGSSVAFLYTVTNIGDVTLTNVTASGNMVGSISLDKTTLAPGESANGTAVYTSSENNLPNPMISSVSATGTPPVGPAVLATDSTDIVLTFNAALEVSQVSGITAGNVGDTITYTYVITNVGDVTLINLTATDNHAGFLTLGATKLAPGGSTAATGVYVIQLSDMGGPIENVVAAVATPPDGQAPIAKVTTPINARPLTFINLPVIMNNYTPRPDLVIERLTATSSGVEVVVRNQGTAAVTDAFWVDVYINPTETPGLNKPWDSIAEQGLVWGVTGVLQVGESITLTIGDAHFHTEFSSMLPLPEGAEVYGLVDSINYDTSYGAILERDEGNNLYGPVTVAVDTGAGMRRTETAAGSGVERPLAAAGLPERAALQRIDEKGAIIK